MVEFKLVAGVIPTQTNTADGSGVEGEAVGYGVSRSSNISNTKEGEEITEVRFCFVDKLEGGSKEIVDCQG